jgi:hypothetical protein
MIPRIHVSGWSAVGAAEKPRGSSPSRPGWACHRGRGRGLLGALLDQPVHLARGHPVDVGVLDHRDQGLFGPPAGLQERGRVGALAQPGDRPTRRSRAADRGARQPAACWPVGQRSSCTCRPSWCLLRRSAGTDRRFSGAAVAELTSGQLDLTGAQLGCPADSTLAAHAWRCPQSGLGGHAGNPPAIRSLSRSQPRWNGMDDGPNPTCGDGPRRHWADGGRPHF